MDLRNQIQSSEFKGWEDGSACEWLPSKHEDLSLIPSIYIQKQSMIVHVSIQVLNRKKMKEVGLTDQPA